MSKTTNDPSGRRSSLRSDPDAHGQAALLLVESLLHGLIERNILSIGDVLAITTAASEVKEEIAAEASESDDTAQHSLRLIARIVASLAYDLKPTEPSNDGSGRVENV